MSQSENSEANIWQPKTVIKISEDTKEVEQKLTALEGQTVFQITTFSFQAGVGALAVYKNGGRLAKYSDWSETATNSFVISVPATSGDIFLAVGKTGITGNVDVRDTDIYVPNFQAIRTYAGTETSLYAQGGTNPGDLGESFFNYVSGAAPGFFVDDDATILVPLGGNGSAAWVGNKYGTSSGAGLIGAEDGNLQDQLNTIEATLENKVDTVSTETISGIKTFISNPRYSGAQVDEPDALVIKEELDSQIATIAGNPTGFTSQVNRPIIFDASDILVGETILTDASIPPNSLVFVDFNLEYFGSAGNTAWWAAALVSTEQAPNVITTDACNIYYNNADNASRVSLPSGQIMVKSDASGEVVLKFINVGSGQEPRLVLRVSGSMPIFVGV